MLNKITIDELIKMKIIFYEFVLKLGDFRKVHYNDFFWNYWSYFKANRRVD